MMTGAHKTREFEGMNPMKQVPVINDNGFVLSESRAILAYLVNQFAPGHVLYPADPMQRAQIDRVLYLTAELWQRGRLMAKAVRDDKKWPVPDDLIQNYVELLKVLEQLAAGKKFLAGDDMSIADISFVCDVSLIGLLGVDVRAAAPGLADWIERMKTELPEYEEFVEKARGQFKERIEAMAGKKIDFKD